MSTVTDIIECPICLDAIDTTQVSNRVTTECGHTFHCNCLMQSCATMGFGCPYCRTAMATAPEEDEESDYEDDEDEEEEEEPFSDDVLRGFRFFFNNVYNEEHDHEDVLEQQEDEEEAAVLPKPSAAFITEALAAQGVTMEQLVKILLQDHDEYEEEEQEFDRISEEVWGQMRIIITNYQPQEQQEQAVEVQPQPQEPQTQVQVQEQVQVQAEAKTSAPNPQRRREFMSHV